ncbi:hypothetical protein J3F81_005319, partial [Coemansia sp. RSA 371]
RHSGSVDPMSRNEFQNMLESDLGGLSVPRDGFGAAERDIIAEYDLPPVYDDPVEEQRPKQSTDQSAAGQAACGKELVSEMILAQFAYNIREQTDNMYIEIFPNDHSATLNEIHIHILQHIHKIKTCRKAKKAIYFV